MSFLSDLVHAKVSELGEAEAAKFFGISERLAGQWARRTKPISLAAVEKVFDPAALAQPEPLREASWEGKKVVWLLPWYKTTNPRTAFSLLRMHDPSRFGGLLVHSDAFIAHARNRLATDFLATGAEWSIWVDDDVVPPSGNAAWFNRQTSMALPEAFAGLHGVNRLISHGKTIVGGCYSGRQPDGKFMFCTDQAPESTLRTLGQRPIDQILPVEWVATGFLLVHRSVYLSVQDKFPELAPATPNGFWQFFKSDDSGSGEDISFCRRALAAGHQPHVDLGCVCAHLGDFAYGPQNTSKRP
jgi:hypothetical protein